MAGPPPSTGTSRIAVARDLLQQAEREGREVLLLETAPQPTMTGVAAAPDDRPRRARGPARLAAAALAGRPGGRARGAGADARPGAGEQRLAERRRRPGRRRAQADAERLGEALRLLGPLQVRADAAADLPLALRLGEPGAASLDGRDRRRSRAGRAHRRDPGPRPRRRDRGARAGDAGAGDGAAPRPRSSCRPTCATASPGSSCSPPQGIAGAFLLDERWRRRSVGLVGPAAQRRPTSRCWPSSTSSSGRCARSPRCARARSPSCWSSRCRCWSWPTPAASTPRSAASSTPGSRLAACCCASPAPSSPPARDDLVPARLRAGDRMLGGALSWSEPLPLAPFPPDSPFAGLPVTEEVRVSRQVLAEPGPDLAGATMASLSDGTPLVTGARRGKGWLILVHTTANTAWTTLPLSGLFVQMMERVLALGPGVGGAERAPLEPSQLLDALRPAGRAAGRLGRDCRPTPSPPPCPGPLHPPGLYAPIGQRDDGDGRRGRPLGAQPAARPDRAAAAWAAAPPAARRSPTRAPPSATWRRRWSWRPCSWRCSTSSSPWPCAACCPAVGWHRAAAAAVAAPALAMPAPGPGRGRRRAASSTSPARPGSPMS